jgi:holo-ACP synthase
MATETIAASLENILTARERRVARQREALALWGMPLISVTLVMPGPQKDSDLTRFLLKTALTEIDDLCAAHGWQICSFDQISQIAGPEALYVVDADAQELKRALLRLEETHQLGRLWDIDVLAPDGASISRRDLGMDGRRCLVCDQPGHACARSRAHTLSELMRVIIEKVDAYRSRQAG